MTEELDRVLQTRAGRRVEYLSITWTSLEASIGVTVGILAGSVALIGFGGFNHRSSLELRPIMVAGGRLD
jgi:hypothetical protein